MSEDRPAAASPKAGGGDAGPAVTEKELSRFTTAFYSDLGDGLLNLQHVKEIADAVTGDTMPIPTSRIQEICEELDLGGGKFDFKQLLLMLADEIIIPDDPDELEITFKAFDKNKDGKLSKEEMYEALQGIPTHALSKAEIKDIVERCDIDGDGELSLSEIIAAIHK